MDLTSLEIFEAVAEHSSVTKAAAVLGRVPSNVTSRIQQLEADLGVALFGRDSRKMTLTCEGETFRSYARRIRGLAAEARQAIRLVRPSGELLLGTMESTAVSRLPDVLSQYRALFPEVSLRLEMGATQDLAREVLKGGLDCALVARPGPDTPWAAQIAVPELDLLQAEQFVTEELLVVLPFEHAQIRSPGDLDVFGLAVLEPGCTYRRMAEAWGNSLRPLPTTEVSSYHAILASVTAGKMAGVMPRSVFERMQWPALPPSFSLGLVDTILIRRKGETSIEIDALRDLLLASTASSPATRVGRH